MRIGVVHPNLNLEGGAEYVTLEIVQALNQAHEVELITFENPDVESLNSFYDADLEYDFSVRKPKGSFVLRYLKGFGFKVRNNLIKRYAKSCKDDYDLLVSGMDEADFGTSGFQYIHFPESVNEQLFHETGEVSTDLTRNSGIGLYRLYIEAVDRFFKEDPEGVERNKTVCNSSFTKEVYQKVFDKECSVVNPPVSLEIQDPKGFDERENGFVCVGKVNPSKGQKEVIELMDEIVENHDTHLHIVGSIGDSNYCREVKKMAEKRDYAQVEGRVDRERLKQLITSHRYGIHNFSGEHYGLAPAEMVKGGCIPFVPSRGGPRDIVDGREELLFSNPRETSSKIESVLENRELQKELYSYVRDLEVNSPEDFRHKIRNEIEECVE